MGYVLGVESCTDTLKQIKWISITSPATLRSDFTCSIYTACASNTSEKMFPFARAQLRRLTLQGNPFREKLAKVNYNIPKALNRSAGISKSPGAVQYFSSWRGRPYNSQSSFRRKYNALGSKVDNIDPNTLVYGIIGANLAVFGCIQFAMVERDPFKLQKVRRFIHDNLAFSI
ncbi:hypothetical protein DSO57_1011482 [Entomophthora muscae]|uniref:Uncharacterized protein n=1 Tax=Entomophthora muscae TaxID=34485 RepID=A0ACC2RXA9_9FUNG|nr:hypothetical protein DSO57_1011482 [Entomophthora muscae]